MTSYADKNIIKTGKMAFAALLVILGMNASAQSWQWAKSAGGVNYDNATKSTTDIWGNIYVTGYFSSGSVSFGPVTINNTDSGTSDIFIAKYDRTGNVIWAKKFGGTNFDYSEAITCDLNGDVIITGYFMSSSIIFDSITLSNTGVGNIYIAKLDSGGHVLWAENETGNATDQVWSVATDPSNNIVISGQYSSSSMQFGAVTLYNVLGSDAFLFKFDAYGNALWANDFAGDGLNNAQSVFIDNYYNVYTCGWFDGTFISFVTDSLYGDSLGNNVAYIAKYSNSGNFLWCKGIAGTGNRQAMALAVDDTGYIYVTGTYDNSIFLGTDSVNTNGQADIFLTKLDSSQNFVWSQTFGGSAADIVEALTIDIYHNIYVSGYYASTSMTIGYDTLYNAGDNDIFFARFNYGGRLFRAISAGGAMDDFGQSLASDALGNVYMAGSFESESIAFGTTTLLNAGGYTGTTDIFVAKFWDPVVAVAPVSKLPENVQLYPNPNDGRMTLAFKQSIPTSIKVVDCLGRETIMIPENLTGENRIQQIDLRDFTPGVYYMALTYPDKLETIPFAIRK